jgi:1-acyl-sn-glycerol-3-phosphate acyltransferase
MIELMIGSLRFLGSAALSMFFAFLAILSIPIDTGGRLFHANARNWARSVLWFCGIQVRIRGIEKVTPDRHYVYVANHASMFDIPSIIAAVPDQIRIVYKKELEKIPLFGWGLKWGSYIGIERSGSRDALKSLDRAAAMIRDGASVLLYAEGTRTMTGLLQPFKRGAFALAVRAGVPVVPLTVNGSFSILRKHSIVVRPGNVELVLSDPINVDQTDSKGSEQELMNRVHAAIEQTYINQPGG